MASCKEHVVELEQQVLISKQKCREATEEVEELKCQLQDACGQIEDYRNKVTSAEFIPLSNMLGVD